MNLFKLFMPGFSRGLVYMLQSTDYRTKKYLAWFWHVEDFGKLMYRRTLDLTMKARLLLIVARIINLLVLAASVLLLWFWAADINDIYYGFLAAGLLIASPVITAHLIVIPVALGEFFIQLPKEQLMLIEARDIFEAHKGEKIAIAGSYGKTTVKEVLATVLSEGKKIAYTEGNLNTPFAISKFAQKLSGKEEVLIIEYGEFSPDDVIKFADLTRPTMGVITGVSAAHLDTLGTVEAAGENIFDLANYLDDKNILVSGESPDAKPFIKPSHDVFDSSGVLGWKISNARTNLNGTSFTMKKGKKTIKAKSKLLGLHSVAQLAMAAALAEKFGMKVSDIEAGLAKTTPFEHRLQPVSLGGNVTLIDDTYNGNIEGVKAGLRFMKDLDANRKVYVTPGLVEQGSISREIHHEIGDAAAEVFDVVYLIQNSSTRSILSGLEMRNFGGETHVVDDPKNFYAHIDKITRPGDVVLMQNDWTDNYF